jgi:hypothetical protein
MKSHTESDIIEIINRDKEDIEFLACNPEWCRWLIGNEYEDQNIDVR